MRASAVANIPTLRELCIDFISTTVINLENSLSVLYFANMHNVPRLEERAAAFVRKSFAGLRTKHSADDLIAALGAQQYAALEKEQLEIESATRRLKLLGAIVETPKAALEPAATTAVTASAKAPAPAESATTRRRFSFGGGGEKCHKCEKTVCLVLDCTPPLASLSSPH